MLHCVDVWQTNDVECRMDHDWQTAMAWGSACPSLSEITFPRMSILFILFYFRDYHSDYRNQ